MRAFEQAAEILFAGDDLCASLAGEAGHGFVFHLKPFEADDADVFRALFPDLALAKVHGHHYMNLNSAVERTGLRAKSLAAKSCG